MTINTSDRERLLLEILYTYRDDHLKYGAQYKFKIELVYTSNDMWLVVVDKFKIRMGRLYLISPELEIPNDLDGPWWKMIQDVLDDMKYVRKLNSDVERSIVKDLATKECEKMNKQSMNVTELESDRVPYISSVGSITDTKQPSLWTRFKTWMKGF